MKIGKIRIVLGAAILFLPGCAGIVEDRVESALVEAGLSPAMAACMAPRWADRLTVSQIRGIQRFAGQVQAEGRTLTPGRLIDHARRWNDPEALLVVSTSAARCAIG